MTLMFGIGAMVAATVGVYAMFGYGDREKERQMKELLTKFDNIANYTHDPAVHTRLQTDIGIAGLRLLGDIAKDVKTIATSAMDARNTSANTSEIAASMERVAKALTHPQPSPMFDELLRLCRKIAGEPEPTPEAAVDDGPWSFTAIAAPETLRALDMKWKFHAKDCWFVMATGDRTGWVENGSDTRGALFGDTSPLQPDEQQNLLELILTRNLDEPNGPQSEGEATP